MRNVLFNKSDILNIVFKILLISVLSIGIVLILLSALAFTITKTDFSYDILFPVTSAILAVSSIFCGFIISRMVKENGLICGVFSGLITSIFILLLSFIYKTFNITPALVTKLLITVISGAAGGIIGVNTN